MKLEIPTTSSLIIPSLNHNRLEIRHLLTILVVESILPNQFHLLRRRAIFRDIVFVKASDLLVAAESFLGL